MSSVVSALPPRLAAQSTAEVEAASHDTL